HVLRRHSDLLRPCASRLRTRISQRARLQLLLRRPRRDTAVLRRRESQEDRRRHSHTASCLEHTGSFQERGRLPNRYCGRL
ncbi:hypothetical protein PMIN03_010188, partial [Paraphaeosphaeria minitans]